MLRHVDYTECRGHAVDKPLALDTYEYHHPGNVGRNCEDLMVFKT